MVVEIMSCLGLAGLSALRDASRGAAARELLATPSPVAMKGEGGPLSLALQSRPQAQTPTVPQPSPRAVVPGGGRVRANATRETSNPRSNERATLPKPSLPAVVPGGGREQASAAREVVTPTSNILPMPVRSAHADLPKPSLPSRRGGSLAELAISHSHIRKFAEECLYAVMGASVAASDVSAAYHIWCAARGHAPLSMPRLAAELKELGYVKWKSNGLMRYRDLQVVA